jgi:hypothetical protein
MKKGKQEQKVEEWRLYKLHCECVRRNQKYTQDYQDWLEKHEKDPAWTFYITGHWMLLRSEDPPNPIERPSLDEIKTLAPPKKIRTPKDDEIDRFVDDGLFAISMGPHLDPYNVPEAASGLVMLTYFPEKDPGKWQRTAINMRLPKRSIMESLEFWVDTWMKERKEAGLKQQAPPGRIHLDTCIEYLKVFDLRMQGSSVREIGELLWPDRYGDREEKAKKYYKKAEKLIMTPPLLGKALGGQEQKAAEIDEK